MISNDLKSALIIGAELLLMSLLLGWAATAGPTHIRGVAIVLVTLLVAVAIAAATLRVAGFNWTDFVLVWPS